MVFVLTKYVLKRLVYIVVVFFIVSFLMYCLFSLIPSDRARTQLEPLKQQLKPEVYEQMYRDLREQMGLGRSDHPALFAMDGPRQGQDDGRI